LIPTLAAIPIVRLLLVANAVLLSLAAAAQASSCLARTSVAMRQVQNAISRKHALDRVGSAQRTCLTGPERLAMMSRTWVLARADTATRAIAKVALITVETPTILNGRTAEEATFALIRCGALRQVVILIRAPEVVLRVEHHAEPTCNAVLHQTLGTAHALQALPFVSITSRAPAKVRLVATRKVSM